MINRTRDNLSENLVTDEIGELDRTRPISPRWVGTAAFLLSLSGVGLSTYMTIAHYTEATILACSGSGELSCTAVTTSAQSRLFAIPVVLLGLGFFLAMSALTSPWIWRRTERWLAILRTSLTLTGALFVLWLVAAEILIIGHIC